MVLLGDAAHTAHFSIGSGTKLAMEDALALAACLQEQPDVPAALTAYEAERRPVVASTQRAAQASLEWFENIGQYVDQPPGSSPSTSSPAAAASPTTTCGCATRSSSPGVDAWFAGCRRRRPRPPMFTPFRLGGLSWRNRVVVSPMDMYSRRRRRARRLPPRPPGRAALGGAGLVMTEMVCVSPEGRITPGCAGIYTAGAGGGLAPDRRLRARARTDARSASSSATPAARARPG